MLVNEEMEKRAMRRRQPWNIRMLAWVRSRPRHLRRVFRKHAIYATFKYALVVLMALFVGTPFLAPSYMSPPPHYKELAARCSGANAKPGCANPLHERIFISVSLYDPVGQHANGPWGRALLDLINIIGKDNVFLSIYENDSGPEGVEALHELEKKVPCKKKIVYEPHVSIKDYPTINLPDGSTHVKRLAYLSDMRNRALRPIDTFDHKMGAFDKILFLNDIIFNPVDAAQLLFSTNVGSDGRTQYLSTCGLDFMNPLLFYDLYAQRDAEGFSNGLPIYPIFSRAGQGISRAAMLAQKDAVPVTSCWGGIVATRAKYVQNLQEKMPDPDFQKIGHAMIDPAHPKNVTAPVRFRYEPEVFVDACECCLFHADVSQAARRDGAEEQGVYVNPYVRVSYSIDGLAWLAWVKRWERLFTIPQAIISAILNMPTHNPHRAVQEGDGFMEELWINSGDGGGYWEKAQRKARNGLFCEVREMQTILMGKSFRLWTWSTPRKPAEQNSDYDDDVDLNSRRPHGGQELAEQQDSCRSDFEFPNIRTPVMTSVRIDLNTRNEVQPPKESSMTGVHRTVLCRLFGNGVLGYGQIESGLSWLA
jgi:hypothetical protein